MQTIILNNIIGYKSPFLTVSYKNHAILQFLPSPHTIPDYSHDGFHNGFRTPLFLFIPSIFYLYITPFIAAYFLFRMGISLQDRERVIVLSLLFIIHLFQLQSRLGKQQVIEHYNFSRTSPIMLQNLIANPKRFKIFFHTGGQQTPIAVSPSVNTLFYIPYHQRLSSF